MVRKRVAFNAFVRGLEYVRRALDGCGEAEAASVLADLFCSARYTGFGPGDGGPRTMRSWSRYEHHAAALRPAVDPAAALAAWWLDETARGLFELLWAEDDRRTEDLAHAYRRRVLSALRGR